MSTLNPNITKPASIRKTTEAFQALPLTPSPKLPKSLVNAQSTSPKIAVNGKELFSRLINLSSAKSILQHLENTVSKLETETSSGNITQLYHLLEDSDYSQTFQHAIHKGLPHPASPVGRENLKKCLDCLVKIKEKSSAHVGFVQYLHKSLTDHVADQFIKALHLDHEMHSKEEKGSSYERLLSLMSSEKLSENGSGWDAFRKTLAIKQPNFDFEAHRSILLMCEESSAKLAS